MSERYVLTLPRSREVGKWDRRNEPVAISFPSWRNISVWKIPGTVIPDTRLTTPSWPENVFSSPVRLPEGAAKKEKFLHGLYSSTIFNPIRLHEQFLISEVKSTSNFSKRISIDSSTRTFIHFFFQLHRIIREKYQKIFLSFYHCNPMLYSRWNQVQRKASFYKRISINSFSNSTGYLEKNMKKFSFLPIIVI